MSGSRQHKNFEEWYRDGYLNPKRLRGLSRKGTPPEMKWFAEHLNKQKKAEKVIIKPIISGFKY